MTRRPSILATLLLTLAIACGSKSGSPAGPEPSGTTGFLWLHTEGNRIVDEKGEQRILRGVNRSGFDYDKSGDGISEEEIAFICTQWKAQIIRYPFNQEWIMNDPAYVATLEKVIGWINTYGAYVLLDLQWRNTTVKIPPIPDEEAITMWRRLAEKFKNNPGVLFDIHNEPHDCSWAEWRARASQIIEAIRAVHPKALIFVGGLDWAYDLRGWENDPLPYANIVYSSHPYPFKSEPWAWDKYFGNAANKLPVFIGEFGGEESHLQWGIALLEYMAGKNLGWTAWSWSNYTYLTQDDRRTPTEFGQLVQNALLEHAGQPPASAVTLSALRVDYIDRDRASVIWNTSSATDGTVRYGKSAAYSDSVHAPALLKTHIIKLTDLEPGTLYHFQAVSVDRLGSRGVSSDSTFTTLP
jgi:endoglucanase